MKLHGILESYTTIFPTEQNSFCRTLRVGQTVTGSALIVTADRAHIVMQETPHGDLTLPVASWAYPTPLHDVASQAAFEALGYRPKALQLMRQNPELPLDIEGVDFRFAFIACHDAPLSGAYVTVPLRERQRTGFSRPIAKLSLFNEVGPEAKAEPTPSTRPIAGTIIDPAA